MFVIHFHLTHPYMVFKELVGVQQTLELNFFPWYLEDEFFQNK